MPFWIRDLEKPRCSCGKPARVEVMNHYNASQGKFCAGCGRRRLRELERTDVDKAKP